MRYLIFTLLITLILATPLLNSCGGNGKPELTAQDSLRAVIDSLEMKIDALKKAGKIDPALALAAVNAYDNYTRKYPKDSLGADYLFKAGDIASNALQQHQQGASYYERIIDGYPSYPKMPEALFLAGFIYQDKLNNGVKAKEYYDKLLEKYPNHDLADDAKAMISFFGKSDQEIIEEFEKKNQEKLNK